MNSFVHFQLKHYNSIRNDIAHNFLPNRISPGITEVNDNKSRSISFGVGKYKTSKSIIKNIYDVLNLICDVLEILFKNKTNETTST